MQKSHAPFRIAAKRTQGFTADPDYWKGEVFVYVGRNQNLKDLKDLKGPALQCRQLAGSTCRGIVEWGILVN